MINLALLSTRRADCDNFSSPLMARAALQIQRNLSNVGYGPAQLARDLGMSRRSIYLKLAAVGSTPKALISHVRLEQAKKDIVDSPGCSLLDIAIANGFRDGACLSRAFRTAYGHPPSWLRRDNPRGVLEKMERE
jgi:AraC-like DNA-binding protein